MMEEKLAIVTGADGGMGQIITKALASAGYSVIMACQNMTKALSVCEVVRQECANEQIEVRNINMASFASVNAFADHLLMEKRHIGFLINNAGILSTPVRRTVDGVETLVSVNYLSPYLLTRRLLPLMSAGSRIVNTVSCTYAIGKINEAFIEKGKEGRFMRIPVYGNTKLALLLFTRELSDRLKNTGITVNAVDPGIVSTNMIRMNKWFDWLTDIFYRPFIKTPEEGASTAIYLALSKEVEGKSGCCFADGKEKKIAARICPPVLQTKLWNETELWFAKKNIRLD